MSQLPTLATLFVDMNAFFASAEQQRRPDLRRRPVAVAAVNTDSTACIAVSYEAKRLGVKGGMQVGRAKEVCPSLQVIEADPPYYVRIHHQIREAFESCLPVNRVESIDEFSGRLARNERDPATAIALARRVKSAISIQAGLYLRCSVGLALNRLLAKVAADMQKPDGLTALLAEDLPHKLFPLHLTDLPGIGSNMHRRLLRQGISNVESLCHASEAKLASVWESVEGRRWWYWLRGRELGERITHRRSVSHSHMLPPALRTTDGARAVLIRLICKAAERLRRMENWARSMEVYVSFTFGEEGWRATVPLGLCQDTPSMIEALVGLWPWRPRGPVTDRPTQVAITLFDLVADACAPLPLFPGERQRVRLADTIDKINVRFGPNRIYFAGMHDTRDAAPTRIAFTRIPELTEEGMMQLPR